MTDHWTMFAAYNGWANHRLYDAVEGLPEGSFHQPARAFFSTLCGTLNHILVADRIWMKRFTGEGDAPTRLDAVLHEDFDGLRHARESEDRRIANWIASLGQNDLAGMIRYRTLTAPDLIEQPLASALAHFFNHQTHHRGQAHAIITKLGGRDAGPALDLAYHLREARS